MNAALHMPTARSLDAQLPQRGSWSESRTWIPSVRAVVDRRLLINFRVAPEALARLLPAPFRPKLVRGWGLAGICLLRLRDARPAGLPAFLGLSSENAAHRIAVEWEDADGVTREGVFVPRRDTASRFNELVGGRVFPGVHHGATFQVWEPGNRFKIAVFPTADPVHPLLRVHAHLTDSLPRDSVFGSVREAEEFFRAGAIGWSPGRRAGELDGLELRALDWHLEPLTTDWVESSFFNDNPFLPAGSWKFDSTFLMRKVECEWHARGREGRF